jgi:hopanoid C-3 methylase
MFFRPDFTREQFAELVDFTIKLEVDCPQYFVLTPIPGTKLFDKAQGTLVEHDFDLWDFNHAVTPTTLPLEQFYEEYMGAYRTHFEPCVTAFYQRKLAQMNEADIDTEMNGLMGFREVFGTLHEDHKEYKGPQASG